MPNIKDNRPVEVQWLHGVEGFVDEIQFFLTTSHAQAPSEQFNANIAQRSALAALLATNALDYLGKNMPRAHANEMSTLPSRYEGEGRDAAIQYYNRALEYLSEQSNLSIYGDAPHLLQAYLQNEMGQRLTGPSGLPNPKHW